MNAVVKACQSGCVSCGAELVYHHQAREMSCLYCGKKLQGETGLQLPVDPGLSCSFFSRNQQCLYRECPFFRPSAMNAVYC